MCLKIGDCLPAFSHILNRPHKGGSLLTALQQLQKLRTTYLLSRISTVTNPSQYWYQSIMQELYTGSVLNLFVRYPRRVRVLLHSMRTEKFYSHTSARYSFKILHFCKLCGYIKNGTLVNEVS